MTQNISEFAKSLSLMTTEQKIQAIEDRIKSNAQKLDLLTEVIDRIKELTKDHKMED